MGRFSVAVCIVLLTAVPGTSARADIITIDPNDFTIGADVSELFRGLSLATVAAAATEDGVYQPLRSPVRVSGGRILSVDYDGHTLGYAGGVADWSDCYFSTRRPPGSFDPCSLYGGSVLEMRFAAPTDFVEIDGAWSVDPTMLLAFDTSGNLVESCYTGSLQADCASFVVPWNNHTNVTRATIARPQRDIAWVVFGSHAGAGATTQIRYRVPEPASFAFVLLGFSVAAIAGRRRRRGRPLSAEHTI